MRNAKLELQTGSRYRFTKRQRSMFLGHQAPWFRCSCMPKSSHKRLAQPRKKIPIFFPEHAPSDVDLLVQAT